MSHVPWTQENPGPENNAVISNFLLVLAKQVSNHGIDTLIVAIEGEPKHRQALLGDNSYKGQRVRENDDRWTHFRRQIKTIRELLPTLIPCAIAGHDSLEADDSIFEMTNRLVEASWFEANDRIIILSSDKDLVQCLDIDDRVQLYSPQQKMFREKSILPYLPLKALQGDTSDNIKGIEGIGPKRAEKIVSDGVEKWLDANTQHRAIYERNLKLMRLHRWNEIDGESKVLVSPWKFSRTRFTSLLLDLNVKAGVNHMADNFENLTIEGLDF